MQTVNNSSITNDSLREAISIRNAARLRQGKAQAALDRAYRVEADAKTEVERQRGAIDNAMTQHARAVEAFVVSGEGDSAPTYLPDPRAEKALHVAESQVTIAKRAVTTLQTKFNAAQTELDEANRNVQAAVKEFVIVEAREIARKVAEHEDKAIALRLSLMGIMDHPLFIQQTGFVQICTLPSDVREAVHARRPFPNSIGVVPRYAEELLDGAKDRVGKSRLSWEQRIADLMEGDVAGATSESSSYAA